jgi:hypothetical protein
MAYQSDPALRCCAHDLRLRQWAVIGRSAMASTSLPTTAASGLGRNTWRGSGTDMTEIERLLRKVGDDIAGFSDAVQTITGNDYPELNSTVMSIKLLLMQLTAVLATIAASSPTYSAVLQDEVVKAFRLYDRMEVCTEDLNDRYQLIIDMLYGKDGIGAGLQKLVDARNGRQVLIDPGLASTALYSPDMYDEHGEFKSDWEPVKPQRTGWWAKRMLGD